MISTNPFATDAMVKASQRPTKKIVDYLQILVSILAFFVVIYLFFMIPTQVKGISMFPYLKDKDVLIANRLIQIVGGENGIIKGYDYQRGDVVAFKLEGQPDLVKRVIGMPGDTIKIENSTIYINGVALDESEYIAPTVNTAGKSFLPEGEERIIPPNNYALIGDNRENSIDSRDSLIGFVDRSNIKGRDFLRVYPLSSIIIIKRPEYNI